MAALLKVPNITLHRSSMANASRIIKHNLLEIGVPQDVVGTIPVLAPYRSSVGAFFSTVTRAMTDAGATANPMLSNVPYYRSGMNAALSILETNIIAAGAPPPPPVLNPPILNNPIPDQNYVYSEIVSFDTSVFWDNSPTNYVISLIQPEFTLDPVTGILSGQADASNISSFNPIITATNVDGSTASNTFSVSVAAGTP